MRLLALIMADILKSSYVFDLFCQDKISQGDSFTDQQLRIIAKDLGVPDDLNVEIRQSPKAYWEAAGLWDIYVEITHDGKLVASGSFDVETGEMGRNIYIYTPI